MERDRCFDNKYTALKVALLLGVGHLTSGCAGIVTAWKNDPLQMYGVKGQTVYTMTGDRRTAVMTKKDSEFKFCAESLPDAVAAFAASSRAKAAATGEAEFELSDQTSAGLLQTFQRTEIAEVYRQMGWNTCLAWAQGAIDDTEYYELLKQMVDRGLAAVNTRASQPIPPTLPYASVTIGSVSPGGGSAQPPASSAKPDEKPKPENKPKPEDKPESGS